MPFLCNMRTSLIGCCSTLLLLSGDRWTFSILSPTSSCHLLFCPTSQQALTALSVFLFLSRLSLLVSFRLFFAHTQWRSIVFFSSPSLNVDLSCRSPWLRSLELQTHGLHAKHLDVSWLSRMGILTFDLDLKDSSSCCTGSSDRMCWWSMVVQGHIPFSR